MKRLLFLLSLVMLVSACGVDNEALKDKVLDAHDEVMPKMGELMKLKKQVLTKAAELAAIDSTNSVIAELKSLAEDLDNSHQGMMDWMHEWSVDAKPHVDGIAPKEETTQFYQVQQEKVDKVKNQINGAIAAAEKALN